MKAILTSVFLALALGVNTAQSQDAAACRADFTRAPAARSCTLIDVRVVSSSSLQCDMSVQCTSVDSRGNTRVRPSMLEVPMSRVSRLYMCDGILSARACSEG